VRLARSSISMRKAATDCVELHHRGRAGTALDPHPARRSQQSCRQGPAAALGSQRSGEPVLAASRRAGAVGPARDTALLAHRGPVAAVRAWLDGGVMRAVGRAWLPDLPGHRGGPADRAVKEAAAWKSGHPGPGPPRPPAPQPPARRRPPPAMTAGPSEDHKDADLDRLTRQYPRWRMWRGRATGDYWAMPPRGHPTARELINASDLGEFARRLARAEERHGP
jgi:hypothetical protein